MRTKLSFLLAFFILFYGCSNYSPAAPRDVKPAKAYVEVTPSFQRLLDSAGLDGSILLFDPEKHTYYSNDFKWAKTGQLPASTFKIPNSIVALETGVILNEDMILPWDGTTRSIANWNQDLAFGDAFAFSCVPCYQQIARDIGFDRMRQHLDTLSYPRGVQFETNNIDMFWLVGEARINQFEQIEFLQRFRQNKLPISEKTSRILRKIMVIDSTDQYILSGKTGWSNDGGNDNGWFVGFVERPKRSDPKAEGQILYFATNVEPKEGVPIQNFIKGRRAVTEEAIKQVSW